MMPRLRAVGAAVLAGLALFAVTAPPASADDALSVQVANQKGRQVDFVVYLNPSVTTAPGTDLASTVVVSGTEVPSEATPIVQASDSRQAILVLDVSGSMRGERLDAAKQAASEYVAALPPGVEIGLVTFNDKVTVELQPTTDKQAVKDAIDALSAIRKTAVFDGIIAGLDIADAGKGARLLVLSDGGDSASAATLDDVLARDQANGIPIDIVALTPTTNNAETLRSIASVSDGQFILATDVAGLSAAFGEASGSFGSKVAVSSTMPEDVNASGKFAVVTVAVDGVDYTGTAQMPETEELASNQPAATVPIPTTPDATTPAAPSGPSPWTAVLYAVLVALIIVTAALAIASYRRQQRSRLRTDQVLWYSSTMTTGVVTTRPPELTRRSMLDNVDRWLSTKSWYPGVDNKLDNGGVTMTVATWLTVRVTVTLVLALLISLLTGFPLVGALIGGALGWVLSGWWLNRREAKRRKSFEEELPDFLLLIASSLRSGLSFNQAVDSTAAEGQGEVSRQMRRALSEVQMGATIEQALTRVSERMQNEDLKWTVTALAIQREVGGNLSNILETAANTVKSRAELRREVRTLSAEGRLSGWVLAALPVGLFLYMLVANRTYVSFFWTQTVGWIALAALAVLFILGFLWVRKLVKIEV